MYVIKVRDNNIMGRTVYFENYPEEVCGFHSTPSIVHATKYYTKCGAKHEIQKLRQYLEFEEDDYDFTVEKI